MKDTVVEYQHESLTLEGYLVSHDDDKKRPGVLVSHAWGGVSDYEKEKSQALAALGYNVLAIDMYGKGIRGESAEENQKLMQPFIDDRAMLRNRINAGLDALKSLNQVDETKIAAVGYCFGGLCVLDLARSGSGIAGVVSVHGLLMPAEALEKQTITAKILALHGYSDPMATPDQLTALGTELTEAKADWQVHAYGMTYHAFTNKAANSVEMGTVYNAGADRRSWQATSNFLAELFG